MAKAKPKTKSKSKPKAKSKSKSKPKRPASPIRKTPKQSAPPSEFRKALVRAVVFVLIVAAVGAGAYYAARVMERSVADRREAEAIPYTIELLDVPTCIPEDTQSAIKRFVIEPFYIQDRSSVRYIVRYPDKALCAKVHAQVAKNPWVAKVHEVKRERDADGRYGRVLVKADYRWPRVLVIDGSDSTRKSYIADDGMVLPSHQVPKWVSWSGKTERYHIDVSQAPGGVARTPMQIIKVQGVSTHAPPAGTLWTAPDLHAAIRLTKLLHSRPYHEQFSTIDVTNYSGRLAKTRSHLQFIAQQGQSSKTTLAFGRFPHPDGGDFELSPARKMENLDRLVSLWDGHLAGACRTIDLQFDPPRRKD